MIHSYFFYKLAFGPGSKYNPLPDAAEFFAFCKRQGLSKPLHMPYSSSKFPPRAMRDENRASAKAKPRDRKNEQIGAYIFDFIPALRCRNTFLRRLPDFAVGDAFNLSVKRSGIATR
jgi:hypothetical protein